MGRVRTESAENVRKNEIVRVLCVRCKQETRHIVCQSLDTSGSERVGQQSDYEISWKSSHQIIQCQGCETVSFRHWGEFSEDEGSSEYLYPIRSKNSLPVKDYFNVPSTLRRIYKEMIDCFNFESYTLCAAGLRAMIEGICADRGVTDGPVEAPKKGGGTQTIRKNNLEGKISGLHEKGFLPKNNTDLLHQHRALGNDAVHELDQPSTSELTLAIEIVEHVLDSLYEIPEKGDDLRVKQERRKRKSP